MLTEPGSGNSGVTVGCTGHPGSAITRTSSSANVRFINALLSTFIFSRVVQIAFVDTPPLGCRAQQSGCRGIDGALARGSRRGGRPNPPALRSTASPRQCLRSPPDEASGATCSLSANQFDIVLGLWVSTWVMSLAGAPGFWGAYFDAHLACSCLAWKTPSRPKLPSAKAWELSL